jgi:hypothetical protein
MGFVVVNATDEPVHDVQVDAQVRDDDGDVVGTVEISIMQPQVIEPGGFGLVIGQAPDDIEATDAIEVSVAVTTVPGLPTEPQFHQSPAIVEVAATDAGFVGTVRNDLESTLGLPSVDIVCFDGGTVTQAGGTMLDVSELAPGQESGFDIEYGYDLEEGVSCDRFLVASTGFVQIL